jgi:hypothetical protein
MIMVLRCFRRVNVWTVPLLAAGAVAACSGPLPSSQHPVQASNASLTYNYPTDEELQQSRGL